MKIGEKSSFGIFFKKPPDDYLFESMIIFCIFFWAIPIFYFPRDIKFDLSSVPAQCEILGILVHLDTSILAKLIPALVCLGLH